jgi:hypothetical protein
MNYVSKEDFQRSQYPASTISGSTRKNIKHHHSNVISEVDYQNGIRPDSSVTSSLDSSYTLSDYSQPITATTAPSLNFSSYSTSTTASNQLKKNIVNTFYLPDLKKISPEYWDIDQVSIWLHAMGFSTVVENFKCKHYLDFYHNHVSLVLQQHPLKIQKRCVS